MNAYRIPNHDGYLLAGSSHESDDFEPTDKQIAARAAYLKPLLLASAADAPDLLATQTGTPAWDDFAKMMHSGDHCEAGKMAAAMLVTASQQEAERIADNELYRWRGNDYQYEDMRTLGRIGARDVWEWLAEWER